MLIFTTMSIRCVGIVTLEDGDFEKVVFFRKFSTVEKRCKLLLGSNYNPIPNPDIFVNNLLVYLGLSTHSKQYVEWRDKACKSTQQPVIEINIGEQKIWPVVVVQKGTYLVYCIPLVEDSNLIGTENFLNVPSISVGFSILLGLLKFFGTKSLPNNEKATAYIELDKYFTLNMPFGTPSDVEPSYSVYGNSSLGILNKQSPWKSTDFKGKPQIHFQISEYIRSIQTDQSGFTPLCEVYGQVTVRAELEDTVKEVSILISHTDSSYPITLDSIVVHPFVQVHSVPAISGTSLLRRLRFSPSQHPFVLFHYYFPQTNELPIYGVFKMRGEKSVDLLIQLKLSDRIKNSFEYCDISVIFYNRGPIKQIDFNANQGFLKTSEDKHSLKWCLGTKFPKDFEVMLTAKLEFLDKPILVDGDPFCANKNCYAQVNFKQNNMNLSGCNIDAKTITISPPCKPKITIEQSIESTEYRLWNVYGDLPFSVNISNKYDKLCS